MINVTNTEDLDDKYMIAKLENIFCIAIASNENVREDINKIFALNKTKYIEAYKNSPIYKSILTQSVNYITESYTEKVIGITEVAITTNVFDDISKLFKKAFKKIYMNTKNKEMITIPDIFKYVSDGMQGNLDLCASLYYYFLTEKLDATAMNLKFILVSTIEVSMIELYAQTNYSDNTINHLRDNIDALKKKLGIKNKSYIVEDLITEILEHDLKNYNKKMIAVNNPANIDTIQKIGDVGRYIGSMEGIFKFLQIDMNDLNAKYVFTPKDIDCLMLTYIYSERFNHFTDRDIAPTIVQAIYMLCFTREYKALKASYMENVNEEYLLNLDKLQKDLENSKNEYKSLTEEVNTKSNLLENKEKSLLDEIEKLKNKNVKLEKELAKEKDLKEEVVKLRNLIFSKENYEEDEYIEEEFNNKYVNYLLPLKIAVIGGSVNWIKKMKEVFPDWTYISLEQKNKDFSSLHGYSMVLINTKMKHSLYFKAKSNIDKYNLTYDYIEPSENIGLTIKNIYNVVSNNIK